MKFDNYSFYKGEKECPFVDINHCFWWNLEYEAVVNNDKKIPENCPPQCGVISGTKCGKGMLNQTLLNRNLGTVQKTSIALVFGRAII